MKKVITVLLTIFWTANANAELLEFNNASQENMSNCVRAAKNGIELKVDGRNAADSKFWYFEGDVFTLGTASGATYFLLECQRYSR